MGAWGCGVLLFMCSRSVCQSAENPGIPRTRLLLTVLISLLCDVSPQLP